MRRPCAARSPRVSSATAFSPRAERAAAHPLGTLEIYSFKTNTPGRTRCPSMKAAARASRRRGPIAVRLYVLAGRAAGKGNYTLRSSATCRPSAAGAARERRCARRAGGSPPRRSPGRIVVVGGEEGAGTIAEVESYDPRRRRWRLHKPLPTPRHGLGAVAYEGSIYVLEGGPTPGLSYSRSVESLRIAP